MLKMFRRMLACGVLFCFVMMIMPVASFAAAPTVKIVVSPNKADIQAGSAPLALTAQASGSGLKYQWTLNGVGKLDNTNLPAVFYLVPEKINGKSAQAVITVLVTDKTGQSITESVTINILPAQQRTTQDAMPAKAGTGMKTSTKVLLGVGALAAAGGVAALAAGGGGDDDNNSSFTGVFRHEFTKTATDGVTPLHIVNTFNLTQNGNAITGTLESVDTFGTCCTAGINTPVAGTVNGSTAAITWGYAKNSCSVENTCGPWTIYTDGGTFNAELINSGKTLRIYDWGDLSRAKRDGDSCSDGGTGDFSRQ